MMRFLQFVFNRPSRSITQTGLEAENAELRELVREMYDWTHYKHTRWARRAAKALRITTEPWDEA